MHITKLWWWEFLLSIPICYLSLDSTEIENLVTICLYFNSASYSACAVKINRFSRIVFDRAFFISNCHCNERLISNSAATSSLNYSYGRKLKHGIEFSSPPAINICMLTSHCISITCPSCLPFSINFG
jgi:hypothetical protein